jgi:all-trans-8'-apo-beta-carotenal 15,15'-oxygenase
MAPHLESCFWFDVVEDSYEVSGVMGRVPNWLLGTWYVNGPAAFQREGMRYRHWLDGDGMVCALRFTDEGLYFTNRFVATRKRREERAAGAPLYRGFGTAFAGDRLRRNLMLESPVNVSVYPYRKRLLAFGEQTLPYELDPETLETRGEFDFGGAINEASPFAAHAKIDGGLLNFGIAFSATSPTLNVYCFAGECQLAWRRRYPLAHPYSLHDFGCTPHHVLFYLSPLLMDFGRFLEGASVVDSLDWKPELGSRILIAPRSAKGEAFTVEAGEAYCLHVINCFENGTHVTMDVLRLEAPVYSQYQPLPDLFLDVSPCHPARYVIDVTNRELVSVDTLPYAQSPDFPSINPDVAGRAADDFWMLGISHAGKRGRKFFDELVHGSWSAGNVSDLYRLPETVYFGGEPAFVANPSAPDEAVVITQIHRPEKQRTDIAVFDAFELRRGPLVTIPLRHPIHPGFHSTFLRRHPGAAL